MGVRSGIFAIDIGGTNIKYGIFGADGGLIRKFETPTNHSGFDGVLFDICNTIKNTRMAVYGVGVGVPGPVCDDGVINGCVNLGWEKINFEQEFHKLLPQIPIRLGNDANLAALGEYYCGAGRISRRLLFVTLGTGVGAGVINDGNIVNGFNGAAGEIGHIPLPYIERYSTLAAQAGYSELEHLASANGLVHCAQIFLSRGGESALSQLATITAKDIVNHAKAGDTIAQQAVEMSTAYLAYGLASVADIVNPDCITLGGGLTNAGSYYFDRVMTLFREVVFHPNVQVPITIAQLGNDAGIYGAASLFLKK